VRAARFVAVSLLLAGAAAGISPRVPAAAARHGPGRLARTPPVSISGVLSNVTAARSLIAHWNGTTWK